MVCACKYTTVLIYIDIKTAPTFFSKTLFCFGNVAKKLVVIIIRKIAVSFCKLRRGDSVKIHVLKTEWSNVSFEEK